MHFAYSAGLTEWLVLCGALIPFIIIKTANTFYWQVKMILVYIYELMNICWTLPVVNRSSQR